MTHKPIGADDVTGELPAVVEARIAATTAAGYVPLASSPTATGVHMNDATTQPAITIGNAPGSAGFPGTGSPPKAVGPLAIYQKFGDSTGGTGASIPNTTQAAYILASYYGPTSDDSAEALSAFVGLKSATNPYTQNKKTTAFEAIAQVESGVTVDDASGAYVLGVGSNVNIINTGHVDKAYGFKASTNSSGGPPYGTMDYYAAFAQLTASGATTAYGVYVVDPVSSETALTLGKTAFSGSYSAKLTGNADSSVSMVLMNLPTSSDVTGGLTGQRIVAASDQTKRLSEWWGAGAGAAGSFVDNSGAINTRLQFSFSDTISDPAAPGADIVRIYQRVNGSTGEIAARFPTGAIKVLATEAPVDTYGFGLVLAFAPGVSGTQAAWGGANESRYARVVAGGTISKVGINVGLQSGNISVAAYTNTGSGRTAKPGTRLATSGAVACPAVGYAEVSLGATIKVERGDWLALSCDNNTATFTMSSNINSDLYAGLAWRGATEHPLPNPPGTLTASTSRWPLLSGVA